MADRRYDDEEIGEILKTAAEMQSGYVKSGSSSGMTLSELQKVAEEVGIDSEDIERAASRLGSAPRGRAPKNPKAVLLEQSVAGELSDETWDELVTELRRFAGRPGTSELSGKTREWTGESELGTVTLRATRRKGRTRLSLLGHVGSPETIVGLGFVGGVLLPLVPVIVAFKLHSSPNPYLIFAMSAAIALLSYVVTTAMIQRQRREFGSQMETLWERVRGMAEDRDRAVSALNAVETRPSGAAESAIIQVQRSGVRVVDGAGLESS